MKIKVYFVPFSIKKGIVLSYAFVVDMTCLWYHKQIVLAVTPFDMKHPECLKWGKPNFTVESLLPNDGYKASFWQTGVREMEEIK